MTMKPEFDFSKGERGKFYHPDSVLNIPVYLGPDADQSGEKNAVILPIDLFFQLLKDLEDLAVAAERVNEPTLTHQQLIDELKADGLLSD